MIISECFANIVTVTGDGQIAGHGGGGIILIPDNNKKKSRREPSCRQEGRRNIMPILRVSGGLLSSSQPTLSLIWSGKEHLLHGRTGASLQGARQERQTGEVIIAG